MSWRVRLPRLNIAIIESRFLQLIGEVESVRVANVTFAITRWSFAA